MLRRDDWGAEESERVSFQGHMIRNYFGITLKALKKMLHLFDMTGVIHTKRIEMDGFYE